MCWGVASAVGEDWNVPALLNCSPNLKGCWCHAAEAERWVTAGSAFGSHTVGQLCFELHLLNLSWREGVKSSGWHAWKLGRRRAAFLEGGIYFI